MNNLLSVAFQNKSLKICELLINNGVNVNDNNCQPLLIEACRLSEIDFVKLFLDNGANVNVKCNYNKTLLMIASEMASKEIVELLLERGADINIKIL